MLGKGVPSITYGLRGLNYYQIELTGPERDLHSAFMAALSPIPLPSSPNFSPSFTTRISVSPFPASTTASIRAGLGTQSSQRASLECQEF